MNYGLREGFGPVLLDYPYVFELDGRKLICNVPEPLLGNVEVFLQVVLFLNMPFLTPLFIYMQEF